MSSTTTLACVTKPSPIVPEARCARLTAISLGISPTHRLQSLEKPHGAVEHESDRPDDDHARDDQVITVAGIARVHDHVAETRAERDHLRGDHDQPGHAQTDPHA